MLSSLLKCRQLFRARHVDLSIDFYLQIYDGDTKAKEDWLENQLFLGTSLQQQHNTKSFAVFVWFEGESNVT